MTPVTSRDGNSLYIPLTRTRARVRAPSLENGVTCCHCCHRDAPRPISEAIADIANRLRFLGPDHRDPEAFHLAKSELVHELRRLARRAA